MRAATFDIGTNAVLMAVAERLQDGRIVPVVERGDITRLGEGVDRSGVLSSAAMERTVAAIARFADEARALGVTRFAAATTSAARDARNRQQFLDAARERAGIDIEVIPGPREAELVFRAVQKDFGSPGAPLVAIDIGGGSTELIVGEGEGSPSFRTSVNVGTVRLTERLVTAHPIPRQDRDAIRACIREVLVDVPPAPPGTVAVAVAATATSLAAVAHQLPGLDDPRVHGSELGVETLAPLLERLADQDLETLRREPSLDPRRADVVCAGGYILLEVLAHLVVRSCRVSDRGVRWGLVYELLESP